MRIWTFQRNLRKTKTQTMCSSCSTRFCRNVRSHAAEYISFLFFFFSIIVGCCCCVSLSSVILLIDHIIFFLFFLNFIDRKLLFFIRFFLYRNHESREEVGEGENNERTNGNWVKLVNRRCLELANVTRNAFSFNFIWWVTELSWVSTLPYSLACDVRIDFEIV